MNNAERFIDIYNQVDKILKNSNNENYGNFEGFVSKVRNSENPIIKNQKDKLIDYANLRNVITHSTRVEGKIIAEPLTEIVDDFNALLDTLSNPPKVFPKFRFKVIGAKKTEKLNVILKIIREKSFSQFPVFDENGFVIELINTNTISRWLGKNFEYEGKIVENTEILQLIDEIEFKNNYKFISRNCDLYSAYDLFIQHIEKHNRNLDVLFITQNGKQNETLLGLITIEDIANKV